MKLKSQWLLLAIVAAIPYLVLGAAGVWWLYQSGWLLGWMVGAAMISLSGWALMRRLFCTQNPLLANSPIAPPPDWSSAASAAWTEIEVIVQQTEFDNIPLDRPEPLLKLAREIVESVAKHFHSRSKAPVLEIPVPHLLRIIELVAHDLRKACSANIPGSHILTINDLVKLKKLFTIAPSLYRLYRVAALVVNPATALARELSLLGQERMLNASTSQTKRWALEFSMKRTGYYAIELYSGHLVLRGIEFSSYTTKQSSLEMAGEQQRTQAVAGEPLRILVMGQVKAGKSSVVNALFGETRASVDVVPRTKGVDAYLLERDGLRRAIILDTAGYEEVTESAIALEQLQKEFSRCDLILLVTSAMTAARDADRQLLDRVRGQFQRMPDREFPPLVVAITHIDQLRPFREWNPPYNIVQPQAAKAQQIRQAVEVTAKELNVDLEIVIPVCTLQDKAYNLEEGLMPAILNSLGPAERLKYLRCLREYKDEEYWKQMWRQAANAGRFLFNSSVSVFKSR